MSIELEFGCSGVILGLVTAYCSVIELVYVSGKNSRITLGFEA